jgi:hypothetical protein
VSDHTIRSVASREGIAIATVKKEVLANITHGLRLASERVIELMPEASARDALIGVGILGEKMQLLQGEPTARRYQRSFQYRRGAAQIERGSTCNIEAGEGARDRRRDSPSEGCSAGKLPAKGSHE